ncbi:DUF4365 domain-containing protein [Paraburkholderia bannensis]|uniref:DUF4365 domain-containing protein n=1 Tax=Paraburkholderia bannensis TaxID=765414 RepID=UPI002AB000FC|nr:DUF4365 domain-containing protein [Paraburkholderia bannensis]
MNAANGNAGEYYFAYVISSVLKWPCRLIDIDIGVDAQIEVLDENKYSTGQFIAIQIKTRSGGERSISVSDEKLLYWKNLELPVYVALVALSSKEPKVYLHFVDPTVDYRKTENGKRCIDFDFEKDGFSPDYAVEFTKKAKKFAGSGRIDEYLGKVAVTTNKIDGAIDRLKEMKGEEIGELVVEGVNARDQLVDAVALANLFEIKKEACEIVGNELNVARGRLNDQIAMAGLLDDAYGIN